MIVRSGIFNAKCFITNSDQSTLGRGQITEIKAVYYSFSTPLCFLTLQGQRQKLESPEISTIVTILTWVRTCGALDKNPFLKEHLTFRMLKETVARDFLPLLFSIKRTYLGP